MLSLLLPVVASTNVSLAILIRHSDARSTSYETCAGEWINGACWMTDTMQTVVAASLTAVTDFNARNASALPAFGNLAGCDKQLRFRLLDSGGTVAKSVRALGDLTSGTDVVIGPGRSSVSTTTAAITGALDIPQISYWSTSTDLDDISLYPRFMRTIPTDQAAASSVCSFWKRQLGLSTVAVLYVQDPFGRAYEEATKVACLALGLTFASEGFSEDESLREKSIRDAVESLSDSGAKALLVLGFPSSLGLIVDSALATGLLTAGTSWVFADSVVSVDFDELSEAAQDALHGSLQIKAVGATDGDPQWTRFANERWAALQPGDFNPHLPADWQIRDDFFTAVDPHTSAILREPGAFAYDAVVTAGLLSCQVAPAGPLPDSFGTQFWNSKRSLSFDGLSGRVEFDEKGDRSSANVQLFNLLGQGATAFSAQLVAQFTEDEWVWKGGSRDNSGVIYNFGELEPPVEALPPTQDEVPPYLIGIVCALAACVVLVLLCALRRKRPGNVMPKDELHRMETEITEVFKCMSGRFNTEEVTLTSILDSYDRFASTPREIVFGRPAQAALGVEAYMCVPDQVVHQGRIDGTAAIVSEVSLAGTDVDKECLAYILYAEAGSSDLTFQGGLKRDCDENGKVLESRTVCDGAARRGMLLRDFVAHEHSRLANLEQAHVVVLRLYTTAAFQSINNPLRDWARYERGEPHPLPATVALLRDALTKLRSVEAEVSRESASSQLLLYRGLKDMAAPDSFMADGGTELAPMSTTSDLSVALRYSASRTITSEHVLLRLITDSFYDRGPNVSFLSAFPNEAEYLFPPLTYLQPTGRTETVAACGMSYQVVDVKPRI